PYNWSWNTVTFTNATHTLQTKAYDAAGNTSLSPTISVTVANGTPTPTPNTPPSITITSPVNGAILKANGNTNISVSASDGDGIASIVIAIDGKSMKTCTNTTSCSYAWSNKSISVGSHSISA